MQANGCRVRPAMTADRAILRVPVHKSVDSMALRLLLIGLLSSLSASVRAGGGYVTVVTTAAPIIDGEKRVGIAGKGFSFEVLAPTEKSYVVQLKSWSRTIYPTIPQRFVQFSQEKPKKVVRSLQQLSFVCPVTDEMKAFLDGKKDAPDTAGVPPPKAGETPAKPVAGDEEGETPVIEVRDDLPEGMVRKGRRLIWQKDGTDMVEIPAGEFLFGKDRHKWHLPRFFIDRFEVSNAQYHRFVSATGHPEPPYWSGAAEKRFAAHNLPVVGVKYEDAVAYTRWAGKRLPTGLEWEKAARGTDGRTYPWGEALPHAGLAQFNEAPKVGVPAKIGKSSRGRSPFGVSDMAGNVAEWVDEWFDTEKRYRVIRGGSWYDTSLYLRTYTREDRLPSDSGIAWGFRCVVDGD